MARRTSVASIKSSSPIAGPSSLKSSKLPSDAHLHHVRSPSGPSWPPTMMPTSSTGTQATASQTGQAVDPDELFTKHTVAEIRAIQQRLRSEADAKQQELRIMVGERYRDLLQASTSIVSIAQSSQRVTHALEEMRTTVLFEGGSEGQMRSGNSSQDDVRLHALQSLAAHVKILLDAPEHLWRLIEAKKYLQAAWLLLLARVVYRALTQDGMDEDEGWEGLDIDVVEQFPLVQRQWESVVPFRSQLTHKAGLGLRDATMSTPDVCGSVIALHLLDSRPLTDTLSTLLSQRTKALHAVLPSSKLDGLPPLSTARKPNGESIGPGRLPNGAAAPPAQSQKRTVHATRDLCQSALAIVYRTMDAAREVYSAKGDLKPLVLRTLRFMQSEAPVPSDSLPQELCLSTETLMSGLPSASHVMLLPSNLRGYKPYVDLSSSSSTISQPQLTERLREWFNQSMSDIRAALCLWFTDLETVRQVWALRRFVQSWTEAFVGLEEAERTRVLSLMDDVSRSRISQIRQAGLDAVKLAFKTATEAALASIPGPVSEGAAVQDIFQLPPILSTIQNVSAGAVPASSYQQYRRSLEHQVLGRDPALDEVLSAVESKVRELKVDVNTMKGEDNRTRELVQDLKASFEPAICQFCESLLSLIEQSCTDLANGPGNPAAYNVLFLGRLAEQLSASETILPQLSLSEVTRNDFREQSLALYKRIIDRWQKSTVNDITRAFFQASGLPSHKPLDVSSCLARPSSSLVRALLALCTAVQQLGLSKWHGRRAAAVQQMLHLFVATLLSDHNDDWPTTSAQAAWDLAFLRHVVNLWGTNCLKAANQLSERISKLSSTTLPTDEQLREYLTRTQALFESLLPSASKGEGSGLLRYGPPVAETQFQPALDLVKPSPRFGLLLVGHSSAP